MIDQDIRRRESIRRGQQRFQLIALAAVFEARPWDVLCHRVLPRVFLEEVVHDGSGDFVDYVVAGDVAELAGVRGNGVPIQPEKVGELVDGWELGVAVFLGDADCAALDDVCGTEGV